MIGIDFGPEEADKSNVGIEEICTELAELSSVSVNWG